MTGLMTNLEETILKFNNIPIYQGGMLRKSMLKSFFKIYHIDSEVGRGLNNSTPMYFKDGKNQRVVILQMIYFSDSKVMAELIFEKDIAEISKKHVLGETTGEEKDEGQYHL